VYIGLKVGTRAGTVKTSVDLLPPLEHSDELRNAARAGGVTGGMMESEQDCVPVGPVQR
jgi:hypothetical protein